jgi:hypothetical protein
MKNKDKFADKINEICVEGCDTFGLDEYGAPVACHELPCLSCKLSESIGEKAEYMCCRECRIKWAEQEYFPPKFKLPKDTTMDELVNFYVDNVCGNTVCADCKFVHFKYCRVTGFVNWAIENDLIELKQDIIIDAKDAKVE